MFILRMVVEFIAIGFEPICAVNWTKASITVNNS